MFTVVGHTETNVYNLYIMWVMCLFCLLFPSKPQTTHPRLKCFPSDLSDFKIIPHFTELIYIYTSWNFLMRVHIQVTHILKSTVVGNLDYFIFDPHLLEDICGKQREFGSPAPSMNSTGNTGNICVRHASVTSEKGQTIYTHTTITYMDGICNDQSQVLSHDSFPKIFLKFK